jgi:hypothetical protein
VEQPFSVTSLDVNIIGAKAKAYLPWKNLLESRCLLPKDAGDERKSKGEVPMAESKLNYYLLLLPLQKQPTVCDIYQV